jgi:hypothetical protein
MSAALRTLDEIWEAGAVAGAGDPPLTQAQADRVAAILAPYRRQLAAREAEAAADARP